MLKCYRFDLVIDRLNGFVLVGLRRHRVGRGGNCDQKKGSFILIDNEQLDNGPMSESSIVNNILREGVRA